MKKNIFRGSGVALITPMKESGEVNYTLLERLLENQIENKTDAIIICGTTGESATMSHKERCEVIKFAVDKVNGRIPVVAGTGSNNTMYSVELSKEAQNIGVDGLLVVTPYYNKTSQNGLIRHYNYIADSVNLPIILYNVPSRTGVNIKPETYLELSKHENIVATKEANGDISSVAETIALCGDNLSVYSGNDDQTVPIMSLGGIGVISVFANICPEKSHQLTENCLNGNIKEAAKIQLEYLKLMNAMFSDVNPIPVKQAMNLMGFDCGRCRMPLDDMPEDKMNKLKEVLREYMLIK